MADVVVPEPTHKEDDLDRPVTLREFRQTLAGQKTEFRHALEEQRTELREFRNVFEKFMKNMEADREKTEQANNKVVEERANMQQMWDEGRMLEYTLLFFKVHHQHHYYNPNKLHVE